MVTDEEIEHPVQQPEQAAQEPEANDQVSAPGSLGIVEATPGDEVRAELLNSRRLEKA